MNLRKLQALCRVMLAPTCFASGASNPAGEHVKMSFGDGERASVLKVRNGRTLAWTVEYSSFAAYYQDLGLVIYSAGSDDSPRRGPSIVGRKVSGMVMWRKTIRGPFFPSKVLAGTNALLLRDRGATPGLKAYWSEFDRTMEAVDARSGITLWKTTCTVTGEPLWMGDDYFAVERPLLSNEALQRAKGTGKPLAVYLELLRIRDRKVMRRIEIPAGAWEWGQDRWSVRQIGNALQFIATKPMVYLVLKDGSMEWQPYNHRLTCAIKLPKRHFSVQRHSPKLVVAK